MQLGPTGYSGLSTRDLPNEDMYILDHLAGFDSELNNTVLDTLQSRGFNNRIFVQYVFDDRVKTRYPKLDLHYSPDSKEEISFRFFRGYKQHPHVDFKNFVCSFNGTPHVGRKLLAASLHKFGYFDQEYCSKNFSFSTDILDGHVVDIVGDREQFWSKFIVDRSAEEFYQTVYSFGHIQFDHDQNIVRLQQKLTNSFLHIVSETMATSYYPFVTEKFLYSVVTRGLFLAYAHPGWHAHLEKYYGFKPYTRIFDYHFDSIDNPVERLVELMTMISKFSRLSKQEWQDLHESERDTIDYNYDHYFSQNYLKHFENLDKHAII
jgi:hypothetical protein